MKSRRFTDDKKTVRCLYRNQKRKHPMRFIFPPFRNNANGDKKGINHMVKIGWHRVTNFFL